MNINKHVTRNEKKETKGISIFNVWRNFDLCAKCILVSYERKFWVISFGSSRYIQNEIINDKLHVSSENGPGYWGFVKPL